MERAPPMVEAEGLAAVFPPHSGRPPVTALQDVTIRVQSGEFVAVIGRSGAGKTTLMRCLTGFVRPTAGRLVVNGFDVRAARARQLRRLRREAATIYQHFHLVERASALDNVLFGRLGYVPTWRSLLGSFPARDRTLAFAALDDLGLGERALQRVDQLSGGERQRVAIARALVQEPRLVLADEPAASLDVALARFVLETLRACNRERGVTIIVNLHDLELARTYADRILALRRGRLMFDGSPDRLDDTTEEEIFHGAATDDGSDGASGSRASGSRASGPPRRPPSSSLKLVAIIAVVVAAHAWAWQGVEMDIALILGSLPHMSDFLGRMVPPDWSVVRTVTGAVAETLQIAIVGTTVGVVLAFPLGFLAAGNVVPPLLRGTVRTVLNAVRSIPLILYALFFVAAVGLGPLAGTLATALYSVGMLGKFFSEAIEAIDPKPVEGVRATGAGTLQTLRFGVLPQVLNHFAAYILYRFELNVREGAILGLVGAGGIGFYITLYMRSFEYGRVATLTLIILVMVIAIDAIGSAVRARLT